MARVTDNSDYEDNVFTYMYMYMNIPEVNTTTVNYQHEQTNNPNLRKWQNVILLEEIPENLL